MQKSKPPRFSSTKYISPELASRLNEQKAILATIQNQENVTCEIFKVSQDHFIKISGLEPKVYSSLKRINLLCPIYSIDEALIFLSTPSLAAWGDSPVKFIPFVEEAVLPDCEKGHLILDACRENDGLEINSDVDLVREMNDLSIVKTIPEEFRDLLWIRCLELAEKACNSSCPVNLYTKLGKQTFDPSDELRESKSVRLDQVVKPKQRVSTVKSVYACDFYNVSWPMAHLGKFVDLNSAQPKSQLSVYLKEKGLSEVFHLRYERENNKWVPRDIVQEKHKYCTLTILNEASRLDARTMLCYYPPSPQDMSWLFDIVKVDSETDSVTTLNPKYRVNHLRPFQTTLYSHKKYDLRIEINYIKTAKNIKACSFEIQDPNRKDRFMGNDIGKEKLAERFELMNICAYEMMQAYKFPLE
jgi:hypothetical protein